MAMKALLQGNAGNYRVRGAVWSLGSLPYRAYIHLIPKKHHPDLPQSFLRAEGMTLQEVLGATKAQVKSTVGKPVENLDLFPSTAPTPRPDTEPSAVLPRRPAPLRYPPPTD